MRSARECLDKHDQVIVVGAFNCDLNDNANSRIQILLSAFADPQPVLNDCSFTNVHNSGSTSSLDFFLCSNNIKALGNCHVDSGVSVSDRFPITCPFEVTHAENRSPSKRKWYSKCEWNKIDLTSSSNVLDSILTRIKRLF